MPANTTGQLYRLIDDEQWLEIGGVKGKHVSVGDSRHIVCVDTGGKVSAYAGENNWIALPNLAYDGTSVSLDKACIGADGTLWAIGNTNIYEYVPRAVATVQKIVHTK